ncbi:MAG: redoxin domain-containing protein [Planctomycetaceae bacterium]|nr:redoxin domain-containing protein [Planctomycetaceae bacterium]
MNVFQVCHSVRQPPSAACPVISGLFLRTASVLIAAFVGAGQTADAADFQFRSISVTGTAAEVRERQSDSNDAASEDVRIYVVCFLGTECPMARVYGPRLSRLADEFRDRGVRIIGVDSNRQDSMGEIRQFANDHSLAFPIVKDESSRIANQYGATRTPEVFVLDHSLRLRYHGRIDDQYAPGISRPHPDREDLRIAIEELLEGQPVTIAETTALGCLIGKIPPENQQPVHENDITYHQHVKVILRSHCLECHRSGEIGPFSMEDPEDVVGWAPTMLETIEDQRMPPWHADPKVNSFQNARHMPESEKQILRDWIAGGLKLGQPEDSDAIEGSDGAATAASAADSGAKWQLGREPDQIVEMRSRPFMVPAEGVVEYQYFVVDPGFEEDKWIAAAEVSPGNRAVVHHAIVFVRPPDGERPEGVGWLGGYVPGQRLIELPPGYARRVSAGSRLVFQMHYTPNGRQQADQTRIGLVFAKPQDVTHELFTMMAIEQEFEIPPGAEDHVVRASLKSIPRDGILLAVTPHMHYRGKTFQLLAQTTQEEKLLNVPAYDFNWQHTYAFREPVALNDVRRLWFECAFDNSETNPFNPDPSQWVTWGDQSYEEMAVAFFEIARPLQGTDNPSRPSRSQANAKNDSDRNAKIDRYVQTVMDRLDSDRDGVIVEEETSIIVRRFGRFRRIDHNSDGIATRDEIRAFAEKIF